MWNKFPIFAIWCDCDVFVTTVFVVIFVESVPDLIFTVFVVVLVIDGLNSGIESVGNASGRVLFADENNKYAVLDAFSVSKFTLHHVDIEHFFNLLL